MLFQSAGAKKRERTHWQLNRSTYPLPQSSKGDEFGAWTLGCIIQLDNAVELRCDIAQLGR